MTIVRVDPPPKDAIDAAWLRGFNESHDRHHTNQETSCLSNAQVQAHYDGAELGDLRTVFPQSHDEGLSS